MATTNKQTNKQTKATKGMPEERKRVCCTCKYSAQECKVSFM